MNDDRGVGVITQVGHTPLTAAVSAGEAAMVSYLASLPGVDVNAASKVRAGDADPYPDGQGMTCGSIALLVFGP